MKRVAAYCRVSTERQKDEQTIDVQKTFIEEWASKNDAVIAQWYLDDGWSGDTLDRPELDNLRNEVGSGVWDAVVFIDRDRLARTLSYQEYVIRELLEKAVEVIFLNNPLAEDKQTRVLQQMYGIVAEMERINIAERMRKGKIHKAKSGNLVGHHAPYGYNYIYKTQDKNGYFQINEAEAEIVKMVFHWVADQGYSFRRVVKELYNLGIKPPKGKKDYWAKSSVARMLNRTDYIGISYYNRNEAVVPKNPTTFEKYKRVKKSSRRVRPKEDWYEIPVPAIIDKALFDKAKQKMRDNFLYGKRNKHYSYLLSGKVMCACGAKRVGDGVNGHHYYRCAARIYKYPLPVKCTYEGVNAEVLDEMVWNKLLSLLSNPKVIKSQVVRWQSKKDRFKNVSKDEISKAKYALEKLIDEEDSYTKAFGSKLITFEKYKDFMEGVKAKRKAIESQTKEVLIESNEVKINLDNIDAVCKEVMDNLKTISDEKKQSYLRGMIESIYVKERREALVNGYIPLYTQAQNIPYEPKHRDCWFAKCWEVDVV